MKKYITEAYNKFPIHKEIIKDIIIKIDTLDTESKEYINNKLKLIQRYEKLKKEDQEYIDIQIKKLEETDSKVSYDLLKNDIDQIKKNKLVSNLQELNINMLTLYLLNFK